MQQASTKVFTRKSEAGSLLDVLKLLKINRTLLWSYAIYSQNLLTKYHKYSSAFSPSEADKLPPYHFYNLTIDLEEGKISPFSPIYSLLQEEHRELFEYIKFNLKRALFVILYLPLELLSFCLQKIWQTLSLYQLLRS